MPSGNRPIVLFTHVPKTSGTSAAERLAPACSLPLMGPQLRAMASQPGGFNIGRSLINSRPIHTDADLISGHLPPQTARLFADRPVRLACFLRDPIERTISALRHSVAKVDPSAYPTLARVMRAGGFDGHGRGDARDFLDACIETGFNRDVMTHQLSGLVPIEAIELTRDDLAAGLIFKPNFALDGHVPPTADLLDSAERALRTTFAFVGFQHLHEQSIQGLASLLGVQPVGPMLKRKGTQGSPLVVDRENPEIEQRLRALNQADLELFDTAVAQHASDTPRPRSLKSA